ncbi:PRC and DUF2382 domain-containing protein [Deinococcus peraridilitoris]|uniref:Conserved domain protein, TIGR02271+C111 n=1 Tax=Deinococcus peraridilitoris (strain DSM 19664 / LMG 22246 / CIP 109416 / KR-200) TaxID=937777 RepID=L0A053_DEIPD|nr:conserved domain protein, TIGR02271+C111 [Deinococcus peraridilitoris DSM 19664]
MAQLIPLSDLMRDHNYDFRSEGIYDPTGDAVYAADGDKIGTVRGAMVEPTTGRLRYLIADVGGWFTSKEVLLPVGMVRLEDDAVYLDNLTKDQVKEMREYRYGESYDDDAQMSDERVLRGSDTRMGNDARVSSAGTFNYRDEDTEDRMFKTPDRLRLLEERLVVDKERYRTGSVEVSKHVENREQQVSVNLSHQEVVIERRPVTESRPVEGNVTLGSGSETLRVDLEAERADVSKQAYVTEEVEIGKRTETETRTFNETVGREVLDVNRTGDVEERGDRGMRGDTNLSNDSDLRDTTPQRSVGSLGGQGLDSAQTSSRLTAVFNSESQAEAAVAELRRLGVTDAHLSFIGHHRGEGAGMTGEGTETSGERRAKNTAGGVAAGAGLGALFGLAAAFIPGVGPFITAGALATTLGAAGGGATAGALVGGTIGGLTSALADAGYSREEADYYGGRVEQGGTLVAVENTSGVDMGQAREVLRRHGGELHGA